MTDVEVAERVLAQLSDQRDRAIIHQRDISAERQLLAYAVFAAGNEAAKGKLAALNRSAQDVTVTITSLDSALVEARKRLTLAKSARGRRLSEEHRANLVAAARARDKRKSANMMGVET